MKTLLIDKTRHRLTLLAEDGRPLFTCRAAFGRAEGAKRRSGDLRTPEGRYFVCLRKEQGKFGPSLGISYPSYGDALAGVRLGIIGEDLLPLFRTSAVSRTRPPWGTGLGGEIYIHAGGSAENWTAGCIALDAGDMESLFPLCGEGTEIVIYQGE